MEMRLDNLQHLLTDGFWLQGWFIDPLHGRFASEAGHQLHIEPKVMDVMLCLARHHGKVVSRKQLLDTVWGDVVVSEEVLTRCISELRTALNDTARQRRFIKTIPKRGYSLIVAPTAAAAPTGETAHGPAASPSSPSAVAAGGLASARGLTESSAHSLTELSAHSLTDANATSSSETSAHSFSGTSAHGFSGTSADSLSGTNAHSLSGTNAQSEVNIDAEGKSVNPKQGGETLNDGRGKSVAALASGRRRFQLAATLVLVGLMAILGVYAYQSWWDKAKHEATGDLVKLAQGHSQLEDTDYALDVAVMPFANLSGDNASDYLGDGLAEDIRSRLMHGGGQRVAARTSSQILSEQGVALSDIGRSLQARFIVEGTVRLIGQQLRVTAQVFATQDSKVLWAESFDGHIDSMFALFDSISSRVAAVLADTSPPSATAPITVLNSKPASSVAYDNYLLGRFHWNKRDLPSIVKAQSYFRSAIAQDPQFSPAYAGLADSLILQYTYSGKEVTDSAAALEQMSVEAEKLIARALEINPQDAEALASRGLLASTHQDNATAIRHYRSSVALNPNYAMARRWLGSALRYVGDINGSMEQFSLALRLDPLHPAIQLNFLYGLFFQGKYSQGLAKSNEFYALTQNPKLQAMQLHVYAITGDLASLFSAARQLQLAETDRSLAGVWLAMALLYLGEDTPVAQYLSRNEKHRELASMMALRLSLALAKRDPDDLRKAATEFEPHLNKPNANAKWVCKPAMYHQTLGLMAWLQQDMREADQHFTRSAEIFRRDCSQSSLQFLEVLAHRLYIARQVEQGAAAAEALTAEGWRVIDKATTAGRGGVEIELGKLALQVANADFAAASKQMQSMENRGWNPQFMMQFMPLYDDFLAAYRAEHGQPESIAQAEQLARGLVADVDLKKYDM